MKRSVGAVLPILLLLVSTSAALGQQKQVSMFEKGVRSAPQIQLSTDVQEEEFTPDAMSMSGMFLGIVGMMAGAAVASGLAQDGCADSPEDRCVSRNAFTGALIAGTALVPVGVHIGNKDRKNLLASLAVSTLAGAAIYYGMRAIPGEPVELAPFVAAPLQIVTSIKVETRK